MDLVCHKRIVMFITTGIFIEFVLIMLLMGYFILYAKAKAKEAVFVALKRNTEALIWQYRKERYSRLWHGIGLVMRCLFVVIVFISHWGYWYHAILYSLIAIFFSWQVFDRGINIIIFEGRNSKQTFFYIDSKNINKFLGKAYWICAGLLIGFIVGWAIIGQRFF